MTNEFLIRNNCISFISFNVIKKYKKKSLKSNLIQDAKNTKF